MKRFEYFEPGSIDEAVELLQEYGEDARPLSGGQSLLVMMRNHLVTPQVVVSLRGISGLDGITHDDQAGLKLGGMTTLRTLETSGTVQEKYPILHQTMTQVATVPVRNLGTIGGNLAHAEPGSDPPQVLIVLDAQAKAVGPAGERLIPVAELITGFFETVLQPGEIITEVHVPPLPARTGAVYLKHRVRAMDLAVVGVAALITLQNGTCQEVKLGLGGVSPTPVRPQQAEDLLRGQAINEALINEAAEAAAQEVSPISDIHGTADYRRELVEVYVRRALIQALEIARAN
jgi:carbon-monoxide dehydrogenase medium subunit